jgi:hypothetical protein
MIEDTVGSGCYHTFTIERRFKIWDHCMNERRDTQRVYVVNNLVQPVIVGDLEVDRPCNNFGGIYVSVQNAACNIVTWEFWDENVSGSCGGNVIRHYTATNACGVESAEFIQVIHLIDNVAPVFSNIPVNSSYDCTFTGEIVIGNPTVSDNCDDDVEVTLVIDTIPGDCPAEKVYRRTWTAEDNCGNITTVVRNINIVDNAGPVFTAGQQTLYSFYCGENPVTPTPTATDACSQVVSITASNGTASGCTGGFNRTWTALDACGNSRTFVQTIAFIDTLAPVFASCPDDVVLPCDVYTLPAPVAPIATDGCSNSVSMDYDQFVFGDAPVVNSLPGGDCLMKTPVRPLDNPCGYPVDWGLALHTMPVQYRYYTIETGEWVRFANRVEVTMRVKVAQLPGQSQLNAGWDVVMTFDNGSSAAEWFNGVHGFKADCGGIAANANEWEYFILQSGATMTGWGAFAGSALSLEHAPINEYFGYQLGTGANNYNGDEDGFGGWFGYSGTFRANANADFINVYGAGDVCCTLDCCPRYYVIRQWTATDCAGNSSICSQTISWDGVVVATDVQGNNVSFNEGMEADRLTSTITAQPNPANNNTLFTFRAANTAKTSVEIYDLTGKKVADVFVGSVEAGNEYRVDFNVSNLATGVYTYRLTNGSEVKIERLIISK